MPEVEHNVVIHSWGEAIYDHRYTMVMYGNRVVSGLVMGLVEKPKSNKTLWQYLANKTSYECMRDNLHKRPRRRRKHGGRKGEWVR